MCIKHHFSINTEIPRIYQSIFKVYTICVEVLQISLSMITAPQNNRLVKSLTYHSADLTLASLWILSFSAIGAIVGFILIPDVVVEAT